MWCTILSACHVYYDVTCNCHSLTLNANVILSNDFDKMPKFIPFNLQSLFMTNTANRTL